MKYVSVSEISPKECEDSRQPTGGASVAVDLVPTNRGVTSANNDNPQGTAPGRLCRGGRRKPPGIKDHPTAPARLDDLPRTCRETDRRRCSGTPHRTRRPAGSRQDDGSRVVVCGRDGTRANRLAVSRSL